MNYKAATDKAYIRMLKARKKEVIKLTSQLVKATITPDEWGDLIYDVLVTAHTQAYKLGRSRGGDTKPDINLDLINGIAGADADQEYLFNFIQDIKNGRYSDSENNLIADSINNRTSLYLQKVRSTSSKGFIDVSADDETFTWKLGANEHCEDCPRIAALSPFTKETLFTHPGEGNTECLGNCTCVLVRDSDNRSTFERVEIY